MNDLQIKLEHVRDKIEGEIFHPFLFNNIDYPSINDDKLFMLVSVLDNANLPMIKQESYALATMFLQIALDTHEKVTNEMVGETNQRYRQLTILAGTYFSGLYYKLLASSNDIQAIRVLAEGIEIINDHKISVYQKEVDGIESLMDSIKQIESSLLKQLTKYIHTTFWDDVITNYLFIKRLLSEKEEFHSKQSSVVFDALKELIFPMRGLSLKDISADQKKHLIDECDMYISHAQRQLVKAMSNIPHLNKAAEERINDLLTTHLNTAKSLVEEGY